MVFFLSIIIVAILSGCDILTNEKNEQLTRPNKMRGWQQIDSEWYYYDDKGKRLQNDWVDHYYLDEEGKMVKNRYVNRFFVDKNGWWSGKFESPDWLMHGEWKKINNGWAYQYNDAIQTVNFSQIRSISRLGYDTDDEETPPEQSKKSYQLAVENGFSILLCDLCFTKDGVPVCFHDEYINRIARNKNGEKLEKSVRIADISYKETLQYDFGIYKGTDYKNTPVLKLEEMLDLASQLNTELYIEIKAGTKEEIQQAVEMTKKYDLEISWAGSTYDECLAVVETDSTARVATMPRNIRKDEIEELLSLKRETNEVFFFAFETAILTDDVLDELRKNKIPFEMGTIDSEVEIINYLTENYQYCTGIESNKIVASKIDIDEIMEGRNK